MYCLAVVAHAFNPSTQEEEAGGSLRVRGQAGLQSEFQHNQGYTEKPCLKNKKTKRKKKKNKCIKATVRNLLIQMIYYRALLVKL